VEFKQELKINLVVTLVSKTQAMEILKMVDIKKVSSVAGIFAVACSTFWSRHVVHRQASTSTHPPALVATQKMSLTTVPHQGALSSYVCLFQGQVSFHEKPCSKAPVFVNIESPNGNYLAGSLTHADGTYDIQVPISAAVQQKMQWHVEAVAPHRI